MARRWRPRVSALLGIVFIAGCQPAMTNTLTQSALASSVSQSPNVGTVAEWPLRFDHHLFGVACFDTQTCLARYDRFDFGNPEPSGPTTALPQQAYDAALTASYGPVARTTPAAQLAWRSKDGTQLQAEVDIAALFADGLIRHQLPREAIADGVSMGFTHILLEVSDRTVNVYTRTMIPTKDAQIPGNKYSFFRDDLIKVFSRTY